MILKAAAKLESGELAGDHELVCMCCGESQRFQLQSLTTGEIVETGHRRSALADPRAAALSPEMWRVSRCGRCGSPSIAVSYVGQHGSLVSASGRRWQAAAA